MLGGGSGGGEVSFGSSIRSFSSVFVRLRTVSFGSCVNAAAAAMALSRETLLCLSFILLLRLCGETVSESSLEVFFVWTPSFWTD